MTDNMSRDIQKAKEILTNIDWGFHYTYGSKKNNTQSFNCRKYHWYPATYVPEIPFTLIEVLTKECAKVYDPFGGCGTTYFQALLLNRIPHTTEISKVSTKYMRSLFVLFNPNIDHKAIVDEINKMLENYNSKIDYSDELLVSDNILKLKQWYSENTFNQLAFLLLLESKYHQNEVKAAIRISISALLKTNSSQDRGWGCIADNVLPKSQQMKDKDVINYFRRHLQKLMTDISEHIENHSMNYERIYNYVSAKPTVFNEDVKTCDKIADESIDLVVTSPPYPNMTDYITSQRLSYYYYDLEMDEDKKMEIGARHKRARKSALNDYLTDMKIANENIANKIKRGCYACYVMPSFNDKENNIERKKVVQAVMNSLGDYDMVLEDEFERTIPSKIRSHNMKWTTLDKEKIYLYRKM